MTASAADDRSGEEVRPAVMEHLGPEERRTLAYASAIGREFDFFLLAAAIGTDEEGLAERVERLTHLGILREAVGGDRFRFAHEESRTEIYRALTASRLRVIHRKIAEAMERLHPNPPDEIVPELGRHFFLGRVPEKSYVYNRRAAERARMDDAPEVAAHDLERARIDLQQLPGDRTAETAQLAIELGDLYYALGDVRGADRLYSEALEKSVHESPDLEARALLARAEVAREQLRGEEAIQRARSARQIFEATANQRGLASVHRVLGRVAYHRGIYREAVDEALAAAEIIERTGDRRLLGRVSIDLGNACRMLGPEYLAESVDWYERAIPLLTETGDWTEAARAYRNLARSVGDERPSDALEHLARSREFAERAHEPRSTAWALLTGVEYRLALGQVEGAERDNQLAGRLLERADDPLGLTRVELNRGSIAERRGRWEEGEAAYRATLRAAAQYHLPAEEAEAEFLLARLHFKTRDLARAREVYREAERHNLPRLRPSLAPGFHELGRQLEEGRPPETVPVQEPTSGPAEKERG